MKNIRRYLALMLAVVMALGSVCSSAAAASMRLPSALKSIQEEAFLGNSRMTGLVTLPDGVTTVGKNAFSASGIYALELPSGVQSVDDQGSAELAYVYVHGDQTTLQGSPFSHYVFGSEGSAAQSWASLVNVPFVNTSALAEVNGFYYQLDHTGNATLLCAVDADAVEANVVIPDMVGESTVTAIGPEAFFGCAQVESIVVPQSAAAAEDAYASCPNADVFVKGETAKLSLEAVDNVWPWYGKGRVRIAADRPAAAMAERTIRLLLDLSIGNDSGSIGTTVMRSFAFDENGEAVLELSLPNDMMAEAAAMGYTQAEIRLDQVLQSSAFIVDPEAEPITVPMANLAGETNPMFTVSNAMEDQLIVELVAGRTYTQRITAGNPYATGKYTIDVCCDAEGSGEGSLLSSVELDLSQTREADITFQLDESFIGESRILDFSCCAEGTDEIVTFDTGYYDVIAAPDVIAASVPSALSSDHDQTGPINTLWTFAVEDATKLQVTLDMQMSSDAYLRIGTQAEVENDTAALYRGETLADETITINGGNLAIWLRALPTADVTWGFCVTSIVATMTDGSEVTVTDPQREAPANLQFSQAASALHGSWDAVEGASSYELYVKRVGEEEYTLVETGSVITENSVSVTAFSTLEQCGVLHYAVRAVFADGGKSGLSEPFEMIALSAPVMTSAQQTAASAFTLCWNAVDHAKSYQILSGTPETGLEIIAAGLTETSYVIVLPDTADRSATYTYFVQAVGDFGVGMAGEEVRFEGLKDFTATQIVLSDTSIELDLSNPTAQLNAEVVGGALQNRNVRYTSLNTDVAHVSSTGVITAVGSGTTYIIVSAADDSAARCRVDVSMERCVVNITDAPETVEMGEEFAISIAADGELSASEEYWLAIEYVYLDAAGGVIGVDRWRYSFEGTGEYWMSPDFYNAASVMISLISDHTFAGGENASVKIDFTPVVSDELDCTIEIMANAYYPGSLSQVYVKANNPEVLASAVPVTIIGRDNAFSINAGTLSKDNDVLRVDVTTPTNWKYYDGTEDTEYYVDVLVDGQQYYRRWFELSGLYGIDATVAVNKTLVRTHETYCEIAAEMPLTFTVDDPTIASIDENGSVTGLRAGETNATVTAESGASVRFAITVTEPSSDDGAEEEVPSVATGMPALYLFAPYAQITAAYGEWTEYFCIAAEIPETMKFADRIGAHISFLDADKNVVDETWYQTKPSSDGTARFWFSPDEFDASVRYVTAELESGDTYTISSPSSATVEVIYPASDSDDALLFSLPSGNNTYIPGQTFSIPVTCTTPELIEESVVVRGVMNYGSSQVESIGTLTLTADKPSGSLEVTISEEAIGGQWLEISLYAGHQRIGVFSFRVSGGISVMSHGFEMAVGSTRQFPLALSEEIESSDLVFTSYDPEIVTVDETGLITAVAPGETDVSVSYTNRYGFIVSQSIWIRAVEVAGENPPTAAMSTDVTEAFYGDAIPLTFQLDKPFELGEGDGIEFSVMTTLLDANMNVLGTSWMYPYTSSMEEATGGFEYTISRWPTSERLQEAAYLRLFFIGDGDDPNRFLAEENVFLIKVTGVPQPGETTYTFALNSMPPFRPGSWIYGDLFRTEATGDYPSIPFELQDADGNVVYSGQFNRNAVRTGVGFSTEGMAALQTHTLYLYVDGEKTDTTIVLSLDEPELYLSVNKQRIALNEQATASVGFYGDGSYSTAVTFESSDEKVFTVGENGQIFAAGVGIAELSAFTESGQMKTVPVLVYDPASTVIPEVYLRQDEDRVFGWFSSVPVILGITTEPYLVADSMSANVAVEFLNDEADVLVRYDMGSLYHSMISAENRTSVWIQNSLWMEALEEGATQVRLTLKPSSYYMIDQNRNSLTIDLPSVENSIHPIVTYTATENVTPGGWFSATFTCHNPASLAGVKREVSLYDCQASEYVAYGYLTQNEPEITLSYQLPESWASYDRMELMYPSSSHNGTQWIQVTTYVTSLDGFDVYSRVAVGDFTIEYPSYSGNIPEITYTSSDEDVASVELYDGYAARITGVAPGVAEITATSGSTSFTAKVVVYDPENTQTPVLYLDQSLNGTEAEWNDYTEIRLCTSTAPELIGDSINPYVKWEWLNGEGAVIETHSDYFYNSALFAYGYEELTVDLSADEACVKGAKAIRITLLDGGYNYTPAESGLSITLKIPDMSRAEEPVFVLMADDYALRDCMYTARVICINPERMDGEYAVTVYTDSSEHVYSMNADNPELTFSVAPDDIYNIWLNVRVESEDDSLSVMMSQTVNLLEIAMHDMVVAIGSTESADQFNFSRPTPVYSIENEEIATIDPNTGLLTGVSAGCTTVVVSIANLTTRALVRVYDPSAAETAKLSLAVCSDESGWPWTNDRGVRRVTVKADTAMENLGGATYVSFNIRFCDDEGNQVWNNVYSTAEYAYFISSASEDITLHFDAPFGQIAAAGATKARVNLTYASGQYSYESSDYVDIPMADLSVMTDEPLFYVDTSDLPSLLYYDQEYSVTFKAGNPYATGSYNVSIQTDDYSSDMYAVPRDREYPNKIIKTEFFDLLKNAEVELRFALASGITPYSSIALEYYVQPADGSAAETLLMSSSHRIASIPVAMQVSTLAELQSEHNYASNTKQYLSYTCEGAESLCITLDPRSLTESNYDVVNIGTPEELKSGTFTYSLSGEIGGRTVTIPGDTVCISFSSDGSVEQWGYAVSQIAAAMADGSTVTITE